MLRRNTLQGLRGTRGGAVLGAAIRRAWGCNQHQVNCNFPAGSFRHASCIVPHRHRGAADREMLLAEEAQLSACLSSAMIRASQSPRRAPVGILHADNGRSVVPLRRRQPSRSSRPGSCDRGSSLGWAEGEEAAEWWRTGSRGLWQAVERSVTHNTSAMLRFSKRCAAGLG